MKRLRQLCAVTILTISLTNVAAADEGILHPGYAPPPPPPGVTAVIEPATAETENRNGDSNVDLTTEITLLLIQNMLALF